jgi:hypothetical protein
MGRTRPSSSNQGASKPRPRSGNDQSSTKNDGDDDDDDDEEEGRSSLGKPKRQKIGKKKAKGKDEPKVATKEGKTEEIMEDGEKDSKPHSSADKEESTKSSPKGPIRYGTYLDVHKAEKAKKKKKKKKQLAN